MDLKLLGFWFLVCIKCAVGSLCHSTRDFSRRDAPAFTVMYSFNNERFYKEIVEFDTRAAFVINSDALVANRVTISVKNNQDKQTIVVNLDQSFFQRMNGIDCRLPNTIFDKYLIWT